MKHISEIIEDILVEWAYRVHDGMPNPTNPQHIIELRESMEELNLPNNVIYQVIQNLINEQEQDDKYEKDKKTMIKWKDEKGEDRETSLATIKTYKYADDYLQDKDKQLAVKAAGLDKKDDKDTPEKEKKQKKKVTFKKATDFLTSKGDEPTDTKPTKKKPATEADKKTSKEVKQNQSDIFNNKVTGKGGGKTSVQEEIAGVSREMAQKYPNDTSEQHKERVKNYIKKNYGDTHWGKKQKTMDELTNKSVSGLSTMKKIKANKGMKYKEDQPEGYPVNITFTDGGTKAVRNSLEEKLKNAKTPEEKAHYERELKYFKKHATSETGVEGDGDTAMMYEDSDGRMRVVYISNKQDLKDPHSNATVKSAAEAIKASREEGANEEALIDRLDGATTDALDANKTMVKNMRKDIDEDREELNKAPLGKIGTKFLTGRAEFVDESFSEEYLAATRENSQVKKWIEDNGKDINNDEDIVEAAIAVAGSGEADGLGGSKKQAPNKLVFKMVTATSSIRTKMQKEIDKGKTPEEAAEIVANKKNDKGKPLMGGNVTPEDCVSIYNNKALEKVEKRIGERKDSMKTAHADMYNGVVELDVAHYMERGMTEEEAIEKYNKEGGPNERTYTKSFMKRMHWDRYTDGVDDDKKMIEINDKSYSPKDFKNCLGELSGWDGKGDLKEYLARNMRVKPGTMELNFVTTEGKEVKIGKDTWRTAGDLSKIAGGLGDDMVDCLGKK